MLSTHSEKAVSNNRSGTADELPTGTRGLDAASYPFRGVWHSRSRLLCDVGGDRRQNSFLVRQDLFLPLLDVCLVQKDGVEFCLIFEDLNLIAQDSLLVRQQHLLVRENFLYSHESNLHLVIRLRLESTSHR